MTIINLKNNKKTERTIQEIIDAYEYLVGGINEKAQITKGRAYGGIVRAGKGKLVESTAKEIVSISWSFLKENPDRINFVSKKIKIPIKRDYINEIQNPDIKKYLLENIDKCYYLQKTDLHVYIDNNFVMAIECKAYTENAMMKRILVDFTLLKEVYPDLDCILFQLESQLGGDYSTLEDNILGSFPTHTLFSYFDIDLHIITLLRGERKVDKPIHKSKHFKRLTKKSLYKAIQVFKELLEKYK